jgi:3-hydroxyisobutyrate dehydrogenase-like beta-hydroxyacid dehydrogenase
MKIAFLGLGNMGSGIASNILKAGFELTVWNRTQAKMQLLINSGAKGAETPKQAVEDADVVVTSLMDDRSILDCLEGEDGMLEGMKPGSVHLCVTTISPQFSDELDSIHKKHGSHFVAGPVLGRPDAAASGELMSFIAGGKEGVDIVTPVCQAYTNQVAPIGVKPSVASTLKLCLNYSVISIIELMGEVYACADKAGLSLDLVKGFYESMFANPVLKMYAEKVRNRDFADGGFRMAGGLKDVKLMLDAAESFGANFEIGKIIEQKMLTAIEQGMEDQDWGAIYEISRQKAGLQ